MAEQDFKIETFVILLLRKAIKDQGSFLDDYLNLPHPFKLS